MESDKTKEYISKLKKYLEISPVSMCSAVNMYYEVTGLVIERDVLMYVIKSNGLDLIEFRRRDDVYLHLS